MNIPFWKLNTNIKVSEGEKPIWYLKYLTNHLLRALVIAMHCIES